MIRTNVLRKVNTITFDQGVLDGNEQYINKSFEVVSEVDEYGETLIRNFINWLIGDITLISVIATNFTLHKDVYDTVFLSRRLTDSLEDYVQEKLTQRLNIHTDELDYRFENTDSIGIPYLDKLSTEELDLFIKDAISSTIGVREITKYIGRKETLNVTEHGQNKEIYSVKFEVITEEGEAVWQSIEI